MREKSLPVKIKDFRREGMNPRRISQALGIGVYAVLEVLRGRDLLPDDRTDFRPGKGAHHDGPTF